MKPIRVIFKVEKWGEVVAFFPDFYLEERKILGFCIGGGYFECPRDYYYNVKKKATPEQYASTLRVLKSYGYDNLKVI